LARHPGQVFIRSQLLDLVWPRSYEGDERTVDVHVARLRCKLSEPQPPRLILTIHGIGYKLAAPKIRLA
jgi:DNA-binding response OmpR family regulator